MTAVDATTGVFLELDDIQAGALYERPSPYVGTYLLLCIHDRNDGRQPVSRLHRIALPAGSADTPDDTSVTVAFTYHGLRALGVPQASLDSFAPEFQQGMAARAEALGDVGESGPENWEQPLGSADVHVAIAVLSSDHTRLDTVAERARAAHAELPGIELVWRQDCYQLETGRTSFGFKDGIGQPAVEGSGRPPSNPHERPLRPGRSSSATPTRPVSCRRCRPRPSSAATAPTSSSASCTRRWLPTASTFATGPRTATTRHCWARRWWDGGRAERRSPSPRTVTTPSSARTSVATTTSGTPMTH